MICPTAISEYRSKNDPDYLIHYVKLQLRNHRVECTFECGELIERSLRITHSFLGCTDRLMGFNYMHREPIFYGLYEPAPDELESLINKHDVKANEFFESRDQINERAIPILYAYYYHITRLTF